MWWCVVVVLVLVLLDLQEEEVAEVLGGPVEHVRTQREDVLIGDLDLLLLMRHQIRTTAGQWPSPGLLAV